MRGFILAALLLSSCGNNDHYIAYHGDSDLRETVKKQGEDIESLKEDYEDINNRLLTFEARVDSLAIQVQTNTVEIETLQSNVSSILGRLSSLEADTRIRAIESPCQDSNEVLVYLVDGRVMAYFESGNNAYLSILSSGTYRTTDNSNCIFTID